ncbi:hypothetical protein [Polaromonas sp. CG_9.5]|uniref:hypothetical protein n=1 Tax=Polaromonas sp. CG_9.5 TaxID=3071705 RepID=UPI002E0FF066
MILVSAVALTGCSTLRHYTTPDEDNLLSGAGSLMVDKTSKTAEKFEQIDIGDLLKHYGLDNPELVSTSAEMTKFQYLRNDLQDRIIAASNQRCGTFLRVLVSSKSQTQMGWSGFATLLSGAASIATPVSAAKALAAGSTVSNAFLSLYNEAYFNNLTVNVISAGISKQREGLLQYMTKEREKPLLQYPVNRAIADALTYHSACNIITGLEAAATATKSPLTANIAPKNQ